VPEFGLHQQGRAPCAGREPRRTEEDRHDGTCATCRAESRVRRHRSHENRIRRRMSRRHCHRRALGECGFCDDLRAVIGGHLPHEVRHLPIAPRVSDDEMPRTESSCGRQACQRFDDVGISRHPRERIRCQQLTFAEHQAAGGPRHLSRASGVRTCCSRHECQRCRCFDVGPQLRQIGAAGTHRDRRHRLFEQRGRPRHFVDAHRESVGSIAHARGRSAGFEENEQPGRRLCPAGACHRPRERGRSDRATEEAPASVAPRRTIVTHCHHLNVSR
jgi:hypothetical protein